MAKEIVAMILAGGRGSRLYALTQKTADVYKRQAFMKPTEEKIHSSPSDLPVYLFKQGNNCLKKLLLNESLLLLYLQKQNVLHVSSTSALGHNQQHIYTCLLYTSFTYYRPDTWSEMQQYHRISVQRNYSFSDERVLLWRFMRGAVSYTHLASSI